LFATIGDDKPAAPVMFPMIDGAGLTAGGTTHAPTPAIGIAPTILAHLELPGDGMDGAAAGSVNGRPPWTVVR
jgi:hypothetical protein